MCKTKKATLVSNPHPRPSPHPSAHSANTIPPSMTRSSTTSTSTTSTTAFNSSESLSSLRDSLRESHILYPFPEIRSATNNFLSPRPWRCSLRGADAVVLPLSLRPGGRLLPDVPTRLAALCRSHHASIARLLGASLPPSDNDGRVYLAYQHVPGATLADCLRNPRNPGFTPLHSWTSRIQIAADLAQGLEYIHHHSSSSKSSLPRGNVHNRIKSSGIIVTEPGFRAKICHFGAAELAGEADPDPDPDPETKRSSSGGVRIEGTRGYIAPEVLAGGRVSQRSDVFAFGVVVLELLSGREPVRYRFDEGRIEMVSLIETAREAYGAGAGVGGEEEGDEGREGRVRRWVDGRLRDSFPVEAAEKLIRVALRCVEAEEGMRPDMVWVAGKVSRLFLESAAWEERVGAVPDFTVSLAPR